MLFNGKIEPSHCSGSSDLNILFCFHGTVQPGQHIHPIHFLPLLIRNVSSNDQQKRKRPVTTVCQHVPVKSSKQTKLVQSKIAFPSTPTSSNILSAVSVVESLATSQSSQASDLVPHDTVSAPCTSTSTVAGYVRENDVAFYREKVKKMSDDEISDLIKNVFRPSNKFSFPATKGRTFRLDWLQLYPWLCYSPSEDGAYCLPCVLFGDRFPNIVFHRQNSLKKFFSQPFRNWSDAPRKFKKHIGKSDSSQSLHNHTLSVFTSFQQQVLGKAQPINIVIDENRRKKIAENKKKLIPIVDTIIVAVWGCHSGDTVMIPSIIQI